MKKLILLCLLIFIHNTAFSAEVFSENSKFGLKDDSGNIVVKARYKKLIRLGKSSWIMQDGTKYGIISDCGEIYTKPKYNQAERILGKYVKFRKGDKYGIFDEKGYEILPPEYTSIDLLYGGMFVTCKNYMYGVTDLSGKVILDNIFDDIYMPDTSHMTLILGSKKIEIERKQGEQISLDYSLDSLRDSANISVSEITESPLAYTGYYGVSFADYILKLFSSISPSYEQTIDELMFSQGADTVNILVKLSWIPQFPFVYAKKYYNNVASPHGGPLSSVKLSLKNRIKD